VIRKKKTVKKAAAKKKIASKRRTIVIKKNPVKKAVIKKKPVLKKKTVVRKKVVVKKTIGIKKPLITAQKSMAGHITLPAHVEKMVRSLYDRKAEDIKVFDVSNTAGLWTYYIVSTGASTVHVSALRDNLKRDLAEINIFKSHEDRDTGSKWIIVDFGDVLVHVFDRETRERFAIERTFGAAEIPVKWLLK
jgi:ribosome-associated protein